jgi:hypothetical protein
LAIADLAGGDWPELARAAALKLSPIDQDSIGTTLLADIKATFQATSRDRLSSEEIVEALHAMEDRSWAEWGKTHKKPISKNQLAGLLREFKIWPDTLRIGVKTAKGYYLSAFEDAFERYLDPPSADTPHSETEQRNKPTAAGTSSDSRPQQAKIDATDWNCEKPNNDGLCYGVTVQKGGSTEKALPPVCEHCGGPQQPDNPVQQCVVDGAWHPLHRDCQREWLDA